MTAAASATDDAVATTSICGATSASVVRSSATDSGFDIFQRTEISVPVIFITAYDSYALKAFENKGIDYLLKQMCIRDSTIPTAATRTTPT